ncbi:hypothetical protein Ahy_A03g015544 [Arachis hypogaea]|uniref:Aminotransferase-like plant mobile domain-containing protein n=1 Tax=Arachis hypogaea TaxID=3818 RepID=A0A445E0X0_ARAHY|nr:hypothetical protein Ahy_A03g015544 [Arachis hypogaea]
MGVYAVPSTYTPRSTQRCWYSTSATVLAFVKWSHWRRHTRYIRWPTAHFRRGLDDIGVDDSIWRPYMGVGIPDVLAAQMVMCSTQSPLVSLECTEWHLTDRVRRQFGMPQLPPGPAFDLGRDHCNLGIQLAALVKVNDEVTKKVTYNYEVGHKKVTLKSLTTKDLQRNLDLRVEDIGCGYVPRVHI